MNFSPYSWRQHTGYLPNPTAPTPLCTAYPTYTSPPLQPGYAHHLYYPSSGLIAAVPPPPPIQPAKEEKKVLPPAKSSSTIVSAPSKLPISANMPSPSSPPPLRPGENYLFPATHTLLHIFSKASPIWESRYAGTALAFKMFKVSTSFTVAQIIERTLKKDADACAGWSVVEVLECGEGRWLKGSRVPYGSEKAKGTLGSMGWGGKRGGVLPPVWLVVLRD